MNNINSPAFRSSMGGFNKKDVNNYIANLNREFTEALKSREDEIGKLTKELSDTKAKLAEASEKFTEDAANELEKANKLIAAQNEQIEALTEQKNALEAEVSETKSKLEHYTAMDSKVNKYESMTNRMGEIFMEATADADRIRNEARETADALIAKTDEECRARRADVESRLNEFAETRRSEIARLLSEAQREIGMILENFESQAHTLANVSLTSVLEGASASDTDNKEA